MINIKLPSWAAMGGTLTRYPCLFVSFRHEENIFDVPTFGHHSRILPYGSSKRKSWIVCQCAVEENSGGYGFSVCEKERGSAIRPGFQPPANGDKRARRPSSVMLQAGGRRLPL